MPGMPSATRISSSGSSSGPVRIIWVNRADGRPAVCTRVCSISEVSPSHADISGLRCGARIRSRMQEHIRYMSIPSIPSMYSFRLDAWDIWNYDEGQNIRVVCYTNAPQARLLLNGRVVGEIKPYDEKTGIIYWDIPFRLVSFVLRVAIRKEMPCRAIPSGHPDVLMPSVPRRIALFCPRPRHCAHNRRGG